MLTFNILWVGVAAWVYHSGVGHKCCLDLTWSYDLRVKIICLLCVRALDCIVRLGCILVIIDMDIYI